MLDFDRDTNHHIQRILQILEIVVSIGLGVPCTLNDVLLLLVWLWCHSSNAALLWVSLDH